MNHCKLATHHYNLRHCSLCNKAIKPFSSLNFARMSNQTNVVSELTLLLPFPLPFLPLPRFPLPLSALPLAVKLSSVSSIVFSTGNGLLVADRGWLTDLLEVAMGNTGPKVVVFEAAGMMTVVAMGNMGPKGLVFEAGGVMTVVAVDATPNATGTTCLGSRVLEGVEEVVTVNGPSCVTAMLEGSINADVEMSLSTGAASHSALHSWQLV
jgi:hypothetical protein